MNFCYAEFFYNAWICDEIGIFYMKYESAIQKIVLKNQTRWFRRAIFFSNQTYYDAYSSLSHQIICALD